MDKTAVVIMEKNKDTGFLEKELGSYSVNHDMNHIDKIYAMEEDGEIIVNLHLTVAGDFEDWEFNAILDNYALELYDNVAVSIEEDEEGYNPTWHLKFKFEANDSDVERKLNGIMDIHDRELKRVLEAIKDLESEYKS
ncbi:hypothetical protein OXPF_40670 [Oxobacter pfennigii]|uniref:Uncharacterized protein n=1 Tax=Oxobacter pfennigii TaxID=36849 RepID=A0A0P9AB49_9CLOT|nr:DUF6762 family protein [Oxobacter pfennigii]KPU42282.1 hypothetical protein OXPF_40670 [Oxobacter pfennigii]